MNGSPSVLARLTQLREHGCVADPTKVAKSYFIGVLYAQSPRSCMVGVFIISP